MSKLVEEAETELVKKLEEKQIQLIKSLNQHESQKAWISDTKANW